MNLTSFNYRGSLLFVVLAVIGTTTMIVGAGSAAGDTVGGPGVPPPLYSLIQYRVN
jgi:hypothetical protein